MAEQKINAQVLNKGARSRRDCAGRNGDTSGWPTRGYDIPPLPGDTESGMVVIPKETLADTWPKRPDIKE